MPAAQALVVFNSDAAIQASGFAATWDPGPFCGAAITLTDASGTFSDGAPPGVPYRCRPALACSACTFTPGAVRWLARRPPATSVSGQTSAGPGRSARG